MRRTRQLAITLLISTAATAQDITLPHTFANDSIADADKVMENFSVLQDSINGRLRTNSESFSTSVGLNSLPNLSSGNRNTALGHSVLSSNQHGGDNTGIGVGALSQNSSGYHNTAIGVAALNGNKTGLNNTVVGSLSMIQAESSSQNVAVGTSTFDSLVSGGNNTAIGHNSDTSIPTLLNSTVIGANAVVDASNKVRIGDTNITVIEGQVAFTTSSDERLKENIKPLQAGLAFINDLEPVQYHRINNTERDIEMGLLAQEVSRVLAKHNLEHSGMVHQATEHSYMSVRYNDLLAPMIKAIQELSSENGEKDTQIKTLEEKIAKQHKELLSVVRAQQAQIAQLQSMMGGQFATE